MGLAYRAGPLVLAVAAGAVVLRWAASDLDDHSAAHDSGAGEAFLFGSLVLLVAQSVALAAIVVRRRPPHLAVYCAVIVGAAFAFRTGTERLTPRVRAEPDLVPAVMRAVIVLVAMTIACCEAWRRGVGRRTSAPAA